jgi:hypothetical protein
LENETNFPFYFFDFYIKILKYDISSVFRMN